MLSIFMGIKLLTLVSKMGFPASGAALDQGVKCIRHLVAGSNAK
jgi:hypothetical protein